MTARHSGHPGRKLAGFVASLGLAVLAAAQIARIAGLPALPPASPGLPANLALVLLLGLGAYLVAGRAGLVTQHLLPGLYNAGAWIAAVALILRALGNLQTIGLLRLATRTLPADAWPPSALLDLWLLSPLCLLLGFACLFVAMGPKESA